ncbi:MAG: Yip1 family protein [Pseudomonadota bacterium]
MSANSEEPQNAEAGAPKEGLAARFSKVRLHAPHLDTAGAKQKAEFILSRCYGLVRAPKAEWEQIRDEDTTVFNILAGYVAPLAVIPPLCDLIGSALFNRLLQGDFGGAVVRAIITFVVSVLLVGLVGLLINALAENFDGDRNDLRAQKVSAYAMTPTFISGFFSLWPGTWWVSIFALGYAVYLFYTGLPILMNASRERALGYAGVVSIAGLIAFFILFSIVSLAASHA